MLESSAAALPDGYSALNVREKFAWQQRSAQLLWGFVALGMTLRLLRYLMCEPMWGDECMLASNFLERGYGELLKPLDFGQICPPVFLWIELFLVRLFGFHEWSLRLFPLLCGLASVWLFQHTASRLLKGWQFLLAVAVFSVSYYPIRHAAEVKPYASDLFFSLVLIALAVEWLRKPEQTRWLWALVGVAPLAMTISYPAVFVAGAVSLALVMIVLQQPKRTWLAYAVFNLAVAATFLGPVMGVAKQQEQHSTGIKEMWQAGFPPSATKPLELTGWLLNAHTGHMMAYPVGSGRGGSLLTFVCCVAAIVFLWKRRLWPWLLLCLGPFALSLAASFLQKYPYGTTARTTQYLVPSICLLMGLGLAELLARIPRLALRRRMAQGTLAALGVLGLGIMVFEVTHPYKTSHDWRHREFARWLWTDKAHNAELVCVGGDLQTDVCSGKWHNITHIYRCFQRLYSAEHRTGFQPPKFDKVTSDHPLRCVVYTSSGMSLNRQEVNQWLDQMQQKWELAGREVHHINPGTGPVYEQQYEIYDFVPRTSSSTLQAQHPEPSRH